MYKVIINRLAVPEGSCTLPGHLVAISKDGEIIFSCDTIERFGKQIPAGFYYCTTTYSLKFKRKLPLVNDVPGRDGIRFHSGNTYEDSSGCILLGTFLNYLDFPKNPTLRASRITLDNFMSKVGSCFILEIQDEDFELPF